MAKTKKCCTFHTVLGIILALLGIYLLTAGMMNEYSLASVLKSAIFWGLFLIIISITYHLKADMKR